MVDRTEGDVYMLKTKAIKWLRDAECKLEHDDSSIRVRESTVEEKPFK